MATEQELKAELERILGEQAALEAEAEARASAMQVKVDAATAALEYSKLLRDLEAKHGKRGKNWDVLRTTEGTIAVRKPNSLHFRRFVDQERPTTEDMDRLVRTCLLTPVADYDRICDELGGAILLACNVVTRLAGFTKAAIEGK